MPTCHVRIHAYAPQRWSRLLFAAALVAVALVAGSLGFTRAAQAATITVNTTTDEYNTGPNCSLREAIQAANSDTAFGGCAAGSGADTIALPSGTYQITINPGPDENANAAGDFDIASSITIQGAGAGSTFVDGRGVDRVFDVAPNGGPAITVGFSGLTIENGKGLGTNFGVGGAMFINNNAAVTIDSSTLANNQSTTGTGGAIENRGTLTLNTVTMQNNTALSLGGAVNSAASGGGGGLTVINSTFTGNKAERGGALLINTDAGTNASITGSTFTGNQAVATAGGVSDDGGAIAINTDNAVNITKSTFTGNSAAANGGAIYFNDSATQAAVAALTMSYNRIAGNTAAAGSGLFHASGTVTAERNWWGCNSGPAAAPCSVVSGNADFTPWIVLTHTANPSTVGTGQAATLTADFLKNSDGSTNVAGDLGALAGVPVSFGSAVLGTISAAQATIQANGAATAAYTAGATPGAGSATATVDSATATANLTLIQSDATPPDTTITSGPTNPSATTTANFSFTGSDNLTPPASLSFQCQLDGGTFTACTSPQSYTGLAAGSHTFQVRAIDAAGNVDPTPAAYAWTIDSTAPSVAMSSAAPDPTNTSPIPVTVQFSENVTGFTAGDIVAGNGTVNNFTAVGGDTYTFDLVPAGQGPVSANIAAGVAQDTAGNFNTAALQFSRSYDSLAPTVTINQASGQADPTLNSPINFAVVFSELVSGFDGSDVNLAASTAPGTLAAQVSGSGTTYNVAVSGMTGNGDVIASIPAGAATDAAGNGSTASSSTDNTVTFVVDSTPPDTTITSNPPNPSSSTSASFAFSGSDDRTPAGSLTFQCRLDGGTFVACTSPQSVGSLGDGSHTFEVRAVDGAGNFDPTPASFTWTVDTTPPNVTINQASGQVDPTAGSPINFTVVFNEPVTGFGDSTDVTLGGTAGATTAAVSGGPTTYNVAVSGMTTDGTVSASILAGVASDAAGNGNAASTSTDAMVTFIANRAPTAVADTYSTNEDTTLTVAAPGVLGNDTDPDAGDTLAALLVSGTSHGAVTLNANGSFSYTPDANYNGPDSFSYKARDSKGAESAAVTVSITVNAVNDPPTIAVAAGGACSSSGTGGTINLTVGDVDSPLGDVILTGSSSNTKLVPTGNIVFGGSSANRTVTITVVPQKNSQNAVITITVKDSVGATATTKVTAPAGTDKKETINGTSAADMIFGLNGDDTINAGNGNDLVCGGNGKGVISGGSGDDTLDGANGDDTLRGDAGNDTLRGGNGNDRLEGGADNDTLTGSSGADFFSGGPGMDSATDFKPSEGDTKDATLETLSASAVDLTKQIYLPVVSH